MTNSREQTGDFCFRYAPVLTLFDCWEASTIAHALTESGVSAFAVGGDVMVAWEHIVAADDAVAKLRRERSDIDWVKVQIDWAKRTSLPSGP